MYGSLSQEKPASPHSVQVSDLSPEELLRNVVDSVNLVLKRAYSLVDFDALEGTKLLQVLADVFATLQPSMQIDLESVPPEESIQLMLDFLLKTLGYKVPPFLQGSYPQSFADAQPTVLYPTMYWVLTHMEQNEKRVYLSRFLTPLDIPDDIRAQDEDVRGLYTQYQQLRTAFVQTHRRVDALRTSFADPVETRRKVSSLEEEVDHLKSYIQAAEKKLAGVREKDAFLAASKTLRAAREENSKLAEKKVELQQAAISTEARRTDISNRLQCVRRDAADGRVDYMVRRMKDEIQTNRIKLDEQLPLELDAKQKENAELRQLLTEPLDMSALVAENQQLDDALKKLNEKVRERQSPGEDGTSVATIKQQVQRVTARKAEVMNELNHLQADNNKVVNEIRDRETQISQLRNATNMLGEEEFREFSSQVRAKKAATESMRKRLTELHTEWGTLTFTKGVLQQRYRELEATIGDLESKLGLQGYGRTMEALSKLTHEKDAIEEMKGKTLDELSRVVQDFNLAIREGRNKLAPLISELRSVRQTAAEVDQLWSDKKAQYEHLEAMLMEDVQNLDQQVTRCKDIVRTNESLFHRLTTQMMVLDAQAKRVAEECTFRANPETSLDPHHQSYSDYLSDITRNLEDRSRKMQVKRREVDESHDTSVQQVEWFNSLRSILEAKLQCMRAGTDDSTAGTRRTNNLDADINNVMGYGAAKGPGVDMLVLNGN